MANDCPKCQNGCPPIPCGGCEEKKEEKKFGNFKILFTPEGLQLGSLISWGEIGFRVMSNFIVVPGTMGQLFLGSFFSQNDLRR